MGLGNPKMDWDNIKTIAQFDGRQLDVGSPPNNERNRNDSNFSLHFGDIADVSEIRPTTSTSLLIESLIQLLCLVLEDDPKLAEKSYNSICEQLNKINLIDNSYAMNEFEEMRSQYQMQIYKIICAVRGDNIPITLPSAKNKSQSVETCWSRYHREFEEISFIAGGGFGKVFRARHKLDCIEYAVKQIKIQSTTIKLCHLAEVKTIASLNHPNIVQYKAAWLEPYIPKNRNEIENTPQIENVDADALISNTNGERTQTENENSKATHGQFTEIQDQDNESSDFIQFERSKGDPESKSSRSSTNSSNKAICKYLSNRRASQSEQFRPKHKLAILYIQMSLCQLTLRKWLNERNNCSSFEEYYLHFFGQRQDNNHLDHVHDIFCQILSGLNYIHSRKIVHHDIKPSNIFLGVESDGKLIAQLGDFGLACPLQSGHHGIALGTPLYAAPEQLQGKCTPKSDIYSLGIILLELLLKFNTDMERVRTIEDARKGVLPQELNKQSSKLLRSLLDHESTRPNTKELMEAIRVINLEQNLRALRVSQSDLKLKDVKINELKLELKSSHHKNVQNEVEISNLLMEIDIRNRKIEDLIQLLKERDEEISKLKQTINSINK